MRGICLAAVVAAASLFGCDDARFAQALEACDVLCDCGIDFGGDANDPQCADRCAAQAGGDFGPVPDRCLACIVDHRDRCLSVQFDCEAECEIDDVDPEPPRPDDEPPVLVDAGIPDAF